VALPTTESGVEALPQRILYMSQLPPNSENPRQGLNASKNPSASQHAPGELPDATTPPAFENPDSTIDQLPASGIVADSFGVDVIDAGETSPYLPPLGANDDGLVPANPSQRYQARRLHRQGGLGAVWLARDTLLGRDVAVKSIRPDRKATPQQLARFVHEARVTGQLEHPGIVPLYDLIPTADTDTAPGTEATRGPRYVMRFVTGQTLTEAAADYQRKQAAGTATRLDLAALLDAVVAVCRAISYAHSRDVLHRDLKGLNVVLGGFGEVFLLDWGLAKTATDDSATASAIGNEGTATGACVLTQAGAVVGTPAFMAPEVAAGQPATKLSDVYGLGAILYEVLTSRAPHGGGSAAEVLKRAGAADPPLVRATNPSVPAALEAVCRKAMARNPADRYASAEELSTDVRRWLADEPVAAYREPWPTRAARWARRRKTTVVAAAVLLVTAAVASSAAAVLIWREQQNTKFAWMQAESEQIKANENADTAITVVDDLSQYVYEAEFSAGRADRNDPRRKRVLDEALASYERLLALHPDDAHVRQNVARMNRLRANLSRFLNETSDAEKFYGQARRHYAELAAAHQGESLFREEAVQTSRDFGLFLQNLGRLKEASQILDDSIRVYEELWQSNPINSGYLRLLANMLLDGSELHYQLGRFAESERSARRSVDLYGKLAEMPNARRETLDPLFQGMAERSVAMALREQGRISEAISAFDSVVRRMAALVKLNADRNMVSQYHQTQAERGRTFSRVPDRYAEGVSELDSAIAGLEKLSAQFPHVPFYMEWQGVGLLYRGRLKLLLRQPDAAAQDLNSAAKILEGMVSRYPDMPDYRGYLGQTWTDLGQLAASQPDTAKLYQKAREMLKGAVQQNPEGFENRQALEELEKLAKAAKP
jgi:tetratricopeptide (TPR) repeat protein